MSIQLLKTVDLEKDVKPLVSDVLDKWDEAIKKSDVPEVGRKLTARTPIVIRAKIFSGEPLTEESKKALKYTLLAHMNEHIKQYIENDKTPPENLDEALKVTYTYLAAVETYCE